MSRLRAGTCAEPGPRDAHCTEDRDHRWSCYDAGDDISWNDGQWEQFDLPAHECDDPKCLAAPVSAGEPKEDADG